MGLLWRRGAKVWRAKGYSHTAAADAIEAQFGKDRGLGRSRIAVLVTTNKEEVPPEVAKFILEDMTVLNPTRWAEYLSEEAKKPHEEAGAVPAVIATEPAAVREVPRQVAAEVAGALKGGLDALGARLEGFLSTAGGKLDALATSLRGTLDPFAASVHSKLDTVQANLNHADAMLEVLEARRGRDKREIIQAVWRAAGLAAIAAVAFVRCPHAPTAPAAAAPVIVSIGHAATEVAGARQDCPRVLLGPIAGTGDMGQKAPEENWVSSGPLPNQKVPPCNAGLAEEAVSGACWVWTAVVKPPCGLLYRSGNKCYRPVAADPSVPVGETKRPPSHESHEPQR